MFARLGYRFRRRDSAIMLRDGLPSKLPSKLPPKLKIQVTWLCVPLRARRETIMNLRLNCGYIACSLQVTKTRSKQNPSLLAKRSQPLHPPCDTIRKQRESGIITSKSPPDIPSIPSFNHRSISCSSPHFPIGLGPRICLLPLYMPCAPLL